MLLENRRPAARPIAWGAFVLAVLVPWSALAEPLDLTQLNEFNTWVQCSEECGELPPSPTFEQQRLYFQCQASCGNARRIWEKDGVAPVDRRDLELAVLETQHAQQPPGAPLVCYRDEDERVVVRGALCAEEVCQAQDQCSPQHCALPVTAELDCTEEEPGGPRCWWPLQVRPPFCPDVVCRANPDRGEASCADTDQDGIPSWLEEATGRSDLEVEEPCGGQVACPLDQRCALEEDTGLGQCEPRDCPNGACPLFHMEVVSEDDQQALVWVYFDHAALPTRVLDLYLGYQREALVLEDARPLPALSLFGKELHSTHLSDGTLRLSVLDTTNTDPIAYGPIIELIFRRNAEASGPLTFSSRGELRQRALAPQQGDQQEALAQDRWWGQEINLGDRDELETRLALWFGFESLGAPLAYADVPDAEALCANIAACANEEDEQRRVRHLSLLERLQRGQLSAGDVVEGVTANAAYMDGENSLLRMPVVLREPYDISEQDFTFSTWFYTEGNVASSELRDSPQLLYSHNGFDERTRWGLLLRPEEEEEGMRLSFFQGDWISKTVPLDEEVIAQQIPLRQWHHVAFALEADGGQAVLYYDGEEAARLTLPVPPAALACPQINNGTDIVLHEEGDLLGGRTTEYAYMGVSRNGLYQIERMNLQGSRSERVLGGDEFSHRDPDYSPLLDRVVYTSNASGSFEVWIARGDGSQPRQVTVGFGDADRGIRARNPRWAPDGTGLVFESNIFDALASDNTFARVYHLYYVGYDPLNNQVSVTLPSGATATQLDYRTLLQSDSLSFARLTEADQGRQHLNPRWLEGRSEQRRGLLLMDTASARFEDRRIEELSVANNIPASRATALEGLGEPGQELSLLAAHRSVRPAVPLPIETRRLFYRRGVSTLQAQDQFTLASRDVEGGVELVITHSPSGYGERCWDRNANHEEDSDEDNNEDNAWDSGDCYPRELRQLLVEYDAAVFTPALLDPDGEFISPGALLAPQSEGGVHKELQLQEVSLQGRAMVRVEVLSPHNALPIPGGEVAVLRFTRRSQAQAQIPFATFVRESREEFLIKDLNLPDPPSTFEAAGQFDLLEGASFSPGGGSLLLAAVKDARPILLRSDSLEGAVEAERISREELRPRGLSWVRQDNLYACGWSGGYLNPFTKQVLSSLRGGLDDMKIYHGLRNAESLRSEVERGFERLDREQRREVPSRLPTCSDSNEDCPDYHLCVNGSCEMVDCDPQDPYSCLTYGGRCVRRPISVEQENAEGTDFFTWVCASDCSVDRQCLTQECLNGPCRFCAQPQEACIECRYQETDFGAFTLAGIEGCPDRNSFACEGGACITECYSFEDGESRYLCDPALEYCDQGRCVLLDWDWPDLSPASFVGLDDARPQLPPQAWEGYTAAVGERFIVELMAYGVEDHNHAPEVVVEVRGGPAWGSSWARLGRALIHNKTRVQGQSKPVVFESPFPFDDIRVRLINAPYQNLSYGATGLGPEDSQFCVSDLRATAVLRGEDPEAVDLSPCYRRSPNSRDNLGYELGIPTHEAIAACRERGHLGCPSLQPGESDYLRAGAAAVIIQDLHVDGASVMNQLSQNKVCSYEGGLAPLDGLRARKIYYGDIQTEQSNAQRALCAANPDACQAPSASVLDFPAQQRGFALLNCNLYDPQQPTTGSAQALFEGLATVREWPARQGAIVFDNGDQCRVEVDALRSTPCYEWEHAASLDPYNAATETWATLEFGVYRGFGHDRGYESVELASHPLRVALSGYTGQGLVLGNRGARQAVQSDGQPSQTVVFAQEVRQGHRYQVEILEQPSTPGQSCRLRLPAEGRMPAGGATVQVDCWTRAPLQGTVTGLEGAVTVSVVSVDEDLNGELRPYRLEVNGDFSLSPGVIGGRAWSLEITQQPRGQRCQISPDAGTQPAQGPSTGLELRCEALPVQPLGVAVSGLRAPGRLRLLERASGQTLVVDSNGRSDFPELVQRGEPYDIAVVEQPSDPAQICAIEGSASGQMPEASHVGARLVCSPRPTFAVTVPIVGLEGDGLRLSLNGVEEVSIPRPVFETGQGGPRVTFQRRLVTGESYDVRVVSQPSGPAQNCQVLQGQGVMGFADTADILVQCTRQLSSAQYALHGTVQGLVGQDLVLINGYGTERVEVDANGAFSFPQTVADGSEYRVSVERAPRNPAQRCQVINGEGVVRGADIRDIEVVCGDGSTIALDIQREASDGAQVQVLIYTLLPEPALVAQSPRDTRLAGGRAAFVAQAPSGNGTAVLTPGEYEIVVRINQDGSTDPDSGQATWTPEDLGSRRRVTVRVNTEDEVNFYTSDFRPLVAPTVRASANSGVAPDASLLCFFSPEGAGPVALPLERGAALVAQATRACEPEEACFARPNVFLNDYIATTDSTQALPRGQYDLICLADEDGDAAIDPGEFSAVLRGVSVSNDAISITLQEVP